MSALDTQVDGDHYKKLSIQPIAFIQANNLDYLQGNVIKYITRHKNKNGRADVEKALHYCQLILELQYSEKEPEKMNEIQSAYDVPFADQFDPPSIVSTNPDNWEFVGLVTNGKEMWDVYRNRISYQTERRNVRTANPF